MKVGALCLTLLGTLSCAASFTCHPLSRGARVGATRQEDLPPTVFPSSGRLISRTTALSERQWNFNDPPRGPFGMKKNAETWNGRVAMMGFTVILLQELITGKGVIQGLANGDFVNFAFAGATAASVLVVTAVIVLKGRNGLDVPTDEM
jgi:hypothetical protein